MPVNTTLPPVGDEGLSPVDPALNEETPPSAIAFHPAES